jgi:hypothetical protein
MQNQDIGPLEISVSSRMLDLLRMSADVFDQPAADLAARPMGLDIETCHRASDVCRRLISGSSLSLQAVELKALYHALEFARREVCSELHAELHELQKSMASIVTSRSLAEIDRLAGLLPGQAEKAARRLRTVLKRDSTILDECEALIKKLHIHLKLSKL